MSCTDYVGHVRRAADDASAFSDHDLRNALTKILRAPNGEHIVMRRFGTVEARLCILNSAPLIVTQAIRS